jgi:hypothetical protein
VQRGNCVGAAGKTESEHGHAEIFFAIIRIFAAETEEAFLGKSELFADKTQVFFQKSGIEAIVAGRDRSVSGKNHLARNARYGIVETDSFFFHAKANRFENGKGAVTFVEMENAGSDSHGTKGAEAADAE